MLRSALQGRGLVGSRSTALGMETPAQIGSRPSGREVYSKGCTGWASPCAPGEHPWPSPHLRARGVLLAERGASAERKLLYLHKLLSSYFSD